MEVLFLLLPAAIYATGNYSVIMKRNIFSETPPPPPQQNIAVTTILKPPPPPDLNTLLELKGIVYFENGDSYIVINFKKRNEEFILKEGEFVEDAELVAIGEKNVAFMYDGRKILIELEKPEAGGFVEVAPGLNAKVDTPQLKMPADVNVPAIPAFREPVHINLESTMKEVMKDTEMMKNLQVSPNVQDGKIEGFRVGNIPPESLIYQYGFRSGDVLKRVNGVLIDSMARGFTVYNQITRDRVDVVTVEVLRNNSPVVFTFRLQ
ncbi:MAG TPA: hypothetical protein PKN36_00825 [bacterium]|nr:hypothetical protein [bacterium]